MSKKKYKVGKDGVARILPREKMTINGKICGAGTVIKLDDKPSEKKAVEDGR